MQDAYEFLPIHQPQTCITGLYVARTSLQAPSGERYDFWGLFCHHHLKVGDFIGMYRGMWIHHSDSFDFGNRYAIDLSHGMTVAPPGQRPDPQQYPISMANEPRPDASANAVLYEYVFGREHVANIPTNVSETVFFGCGLIACADIPPNTEICWHYGRKYERDYPVGEACTAKPNAHPVDVLKRPLSFDAVSPMLDSPSNTSDDDSDPDYGSSVLQNAHKISKISTDTEWKTERNRHLQLADTLLSIQRPAKKVRFCL